MTVSQRGDFAASGEIGSRTVEISTNGTGTLSIATVDDETDETDGTITITVASGEGYVVSESAGSASLAVNDNDGASIPVISISPTSTTIEGGQTPRVSD